MRTSLLKRFAGIFLALFVTATVAVSSNNADGRGRNRTSGGSCVNSISGLNQEQKDQIISLNEGHQTAMNELREKRRSTSDLTQKDQIREQMNAQITTHKNAVKELLNANQQKQFDQIVGNGGSQQNYGKQGKRRQGSGTCNGSGSGRRGR